MTIRKNRPPPNVVVPRTPAGKSAKSGKGSSSTKSGGSVSGSGGTSKSSQAKLGSNAFSVDHVDHADPDQQRGRQQFQNTNGPAAETLSKAAKKAVTHEGKLRRSQTPKENKEAKVKDAPRNHETRKSNKSDKSTSKKGSTNVADDDDGPDGVALKAAKAAATGASKVGSTSTTKTQKAQKAEGSGGAKAEASGKAEGGGKGKGGHARVERKSSGGERLEANERVSIAVESSGKGDGGGAISGEGKSSGGGAELGDAEKAVSADTGKIAADKANLPVAEIAGGAAVAATAVALGSEIQGAGEIQRAGETTEIKDTAFQAAVSDVPKGAVLEQAQQRARGGELERPLEKVASGQLESDIQDDLHANAVDAKNPGAVADKDNPFDDVSRSIVEDGAPIDGVLGDEASRTKAAKKGLPFVKDGTRRGIDAPVEKAVNEMAVATGKQGVDSTDIASDTQKAGAAEDGEGEGEGEEEEDEDED